MEPTNFNSIKFNTPIKGVFINVIKWGSKMHVQLIDNGIATKTIEDINPVWEDILGAVGSLHATI